MLIETKSSSDDEIAFAHDYLLVYRGGERTFAAMADMAPQAPIYTLFYDEQGTNQRFSNHPVKTSPLQRLGINQGNFRRLLPILPAAAAMLSARRHKLLVSSSSAFAHGVSVGPDTVHVCYCHTPFRYAWFEQERALGEVPRAIRPLARTTLRAIRERDRRITRNVTRYVANSEICRRRVQRFWNRDAEVVHPPVEVNRFTVGQPEDYFLMVTELVAHKRVDFALESATRADRRVVVVGDGPEGQRLRSRHSDRHDFVGRASDEQLERLYSSALALLVPNVEEFGIAAVEAQAAGRPVLGVAAGGVLETVVPGETGELVPVDDDAALAEALRSVDFTRFDPQRIRANAMRFSVQGFQEGLLGQIDAARR